MAAIIIRLAASITSFKTTTETLQSCKETKTLVVKVPEDLCKVS